MAELSLKKDIMNALESEETIVKLNDISHLKRYKKDALGKDCDILLLDFNYITGIRGGLSYRIEARTYDGILDEIEKYTLEYFESCATAAVKNLRNGYR